MNWYNPRSWFAETKVQVRNLESEQGRPAIGTALSPHRDSQANTLTPDKLASLMSAADQGEVEAYLTLADEIEEREPHYCSVLGTRKLGVTGIEPTVEGHDDSREQQALVEDIEDLVTKPEFEGLVMDLLDGIAKGFSAVEIMWERDAKRWEPAAYSHRPARHFIFDRDTLSTVRLRTYADPLEGEALQPFKWLVHKPKIRSGLPFQTGLARTQAIIYAAKTFTVADWQIFLDAYGMPMRVGYFQEEHKSQARDLRRALEKLGHDAVGVFPAGMNIELIERKVSGGSVFLEALEYWDKQTSKLVIGQTMTSDDGASLAQSKTHERVRFDIRAADARAVTATINRDLVRPFIDLNYGPQEKYPLVKIVAEEPEDMKALMESTKIFVDLGGRVQESEVRDALGWSEPDEGSDVLKPGAAIVAEHAPKPAPGQPVAPGKGGAAKPGDKVTKDDKTGKAERAPNRAQFSRVEDVVDDIVEARIDDEWRPLMNENVGRLIELLKQAKTKDEAFAILDELARDEGEEIAVGLVTASLARATFQSRGVGDATDEVKP